MENMKNKIKDLKAKLRTKEAALMVLRKDFDREQIQINLIQDFDIAGMYQQAAIDAQEKLKLYEETKINPDILCDLQNQLDEIVADLDMKQKEITDLTQQLQHKKKECETLVSQNPSSKEELHQVKAKAKECSRKLVIRDKELSSARKLLDNANATVEMHKKQLPAILAERREESVRKLELQIDDITREMNTEKDRNSQLEQQIKNTQIQISELETRLKNARLIIDVLETERDSLKTETQQPPVDVTNLRNELAVTRMRLEEKICNNERMQTELDLRQNETLLDSPRLSIDTDWMKEYQVQKSEWNKTHTGLVKQINDLISDVSVLRSENKDHVAANTDVAIETKRLKDKQTDNERHIKKLQDKIAVQYEAEKEARTAIAKSAELTHTISMLRSSVETKTREVEELKLSMTLPPIIRTSAAPEYKKLQNKLDTETETHNTTKLQLRKLQESYHGVMERLDWREKMMKQMEEEHQQLTRRKEMTIRELRNASTVIDPKADMTNTELKKVRRENDKLKTRINHLEDCQILRV